ncbi:hypothetical protein [Flavobacterium sp. LAR06]|uniref:hypothetical protein n=1 Tax=Flavobacterium sp. LAR06 TaxID=3064897 RepID=UPI0035BEB964
MKNKIKFELLTSELFILGIFTVLVNDFYLKYEFSNIITGKLSDFAGLFIFPFFLAVFFPKQILKIYCLTGVFFIFWKFQISDGFINWISQSLNLAFYRTVDSSDLIALSVLPFSYQYFKRKYVEDKKSFFLVNSLIGTLCAFTILADSQPRQKIALKIKSDKVYLMPISKKNLYKKLNVNTIGGKIEELEGDINFSFDIPEYNTTATAMTRITEDSKGNLFIKVDSITDITVRGKLILGIKKSDLEGTKKLTKSQLESFFEQNCIKELLSRGFFKSDTFYAGAKY